MLRCYPRDAGLHKGICSITSQRHTSFRRKSHPQRQSFVAPGGQNLTATRLSSTGHGYAVQESRFSVKNYAALSIVVSCATLVFGMNVASGKERGVPLFAFIGDNERSVSSSSKVVHTKDTTQTVADSAVADTMLAAATPVSVDLQKESAEEKVAAIMSESQTEETGLSQELTNTAIADLGAQDFGAEGQVTLYTVQEGDTLGQIAKQNNVSLNTLLWANEVEDVDDISPGDTIFILPVSGVKHVVKKDDTIDEIAKEYKAEKDKIIAFNDLPADGSLSEGEELIIPGGEKELPEAVAPSQPTQNTLVRRGYTNSNGAGTAQFSGGTVTGRRKGSHHFPWGYCTYYVAQKRTVPWRGNAGAWLYNARAAGYKTGKKPKKGSIVVTTDHPYYGHVAYVEKVHKDSITVSEMNYKAFGKVNTRTIPKNSRSIRGYIY